MPSSPDAIGWYDAHAGAQAPVYGSLRAEDVLGSVADLLPATPGVVVMDVLDRLDDHQVGRRGAGVEIR